MRAILRKSFFYGTSVCLFFAVICAVMFFRNGMKQNNSSEIKEIVRGMISNCVPMDYTKSLRIQTRDLTFNVFEGLYQVDAKTSEIKPCLAKSCKISEDKKKYVFCLKENIVFHNDQKFTADDVKFSIERVLRPETRSYMANDMLLIKGAKEVLDGKEKHAVGITVVSDYEIQIECIESSNLFFNYIGVLLPIYPKTACAEAGDDWGKKIIIGTGPFKVESYDFDEGCKLKRFENYHEDKPLIDSMFFKFYGDYNAIMLDYESCNIDLVMLSDKIVYQYTKNEKFSSHVRFYDSSGVYFVQFNLNKEPWNNIKIREAFSYSIDVESICNDLSKGKITPSGCLTIPKSLGFDGDVPVKKYDPEKSLKILKEAGINTPVKVEFPLVNLDDWVGQIVIAIQEQCKKGGFEIDIISMDNTGWAETRAKGNLPITVGSWFMEFPNIGLLFRAMFYSKNSGNYSSNYKSVKFDSAIENAVKTFDENLQHELYKEADKILCRKDFAAIPIGYPKDYYMIQPWVKNFDIKNYIFPFKYCDIDLDEKNKQ
jgi:peptide/nickel transport system substrate-binding protein